MCFLPVYVSIKVTKVQNLFLSFFNWLERGFASNRVTNTISRDDRVCSPIIDRLQNTKVRRGIRGHILNYVGAIIYLIVILLFNTKARTFVHCCRQL